MIAMQYNIVLPGDYDMDIIKNRIYDNGNKTDGFNGLHMKAYLVAEKSKFNNHENQYAPFYLWDTADGMNQFLLGGPFNNILNSFGWTSVNNWIVLHAHVNKLPDAQYAVTERRLIPQFASLTAVYDNEHDIFAQRSTDTTTTAFITAYNPATWELCHFHMVNRLDALEYAAKENLVFDVYHIS